MNEIIVGLCIYFVGVGFLLMCLAFLELGATKENPLYSLPAVVRVAILLWPISMASVLLGMIAGGLHFIFSGFFKLFKG